jgi:carboxylesterase type B
MSGTVTVDVAEGTLRGKQTTSVAGFQYYSFKGIPYAKPPVGLLRFKVSRGLYYFCTVLVMMNEATSGW